MVETKGNLYITEGVPPCQIQAEVVFIGEDLVAMVSGGEKPHVGAVAIGIPRSSLANPETVSATASVFAMLGHKEDDLARIMARELAAALKRNVVVTVGIHIDQLSPEGIGSIEESCRNILEKLIQQLSACNI